MAPKKLRTSTKFTDVQKTLKSQKAAIFRDKEGRESLYVLSPYHIDYLHSYAEDSPFFLGLAEGRLRGTKCTACGYVFATPRTYCQYCQAPAKWVDLPLEGRVHTWTTCHYGSEAFLKETPYNLAMIEFDGADSVLLARLKDCKEKDIYVGMPVVAKFAAKPQYSITDVWFVPQKNGPAAPARKGAKKRSR